MNILDIQKLKKNFGGLVAVNEVDLSMEEKEIHAIIGPNGAGKTTLFNCITGIYRHDSGDVYYKEENINDDKPHQVAKKGIARTFQTIHLFPHLSVLDNTKVGTHHLFSTFIWEAFTRNKKYKREEEEIEQLSEEMLEKVGLGKKKDYLARNLPYGEQRKLEIARALASKPSILLLDEPVAGMNVAESEELMEFIRTLRKDEGISVLLIEHDMKFVMDIADVITVVDYGKKIAEGGAEDIQNNEKVIEAYLGSGRYST